MAESLKIEVPVLVKGALRADDDESAPKLSVQSIQPVVDIKIKLPQNERIKVKLESASEAMLGSLKTMITAAPGPGSLMINLESRGEYCVMLEPENLTAAADRGFIERAEQLLGQGAVQALSKGRVDSRLPPCPRCKMVPFQVGRGALTPVKD